MERIHLPTVFVNTPRDSNAEGFKPDALFSCHETLSALYATWQIGATGRGVDRALRHVHVLLLRLAGAHRMGRSNTITAFERLGPFG